MRPTLIVMVKEPRPGRVKTRLGRDIGLVAAAWWFRHQTRALLRRVRDPRWDIVLAVSPDYQGLNSRIWPSDLRRIAQGRGDLGHRMGRVMNAAGTGPVCVIGADIPAITRAHIARAFRALGDHDAVFGPAPDGGYWLVGVKSARRARPGMFGPVRWSTEHALTDSMAALKDRRVALVDCLNDVDTAADLR
ncbi:TIGR04282 family arsenosugar biosynthesis glycosyltransferase [Arenibacterium sp. CAU 1754]